MNYTRWSPRLGACEFRVSSRFAKRACRIPFCRNSRSYDEESGAICIRTIGAVG